MNSNTIKQLSRAFSVQDIMTEVSLLKRAQTLDDARNLFYEYDVVPYPQMNKIEGFFKRDSEERHSIETAFIVSEGTSLFDLPQLFCENYFYFVISANKIVGYVHYSDLNKPLVKIPFFAMFHAVERNLWDKIQRRISEPDLRNLFPDDVERFLNQKRKAEKNSVDLGWEGIFSFPYILKLARRYGLTDLTDVEIKRLKEIRNKVAHSDHHLIKNKEDLKTLVESHTNFINLLI